MSRQLKCSNNRGRPEKKTFFSKGSSCDMLELIKENTLVSYTYLSAAV